MTRQEREAGLPSVLNAENLSQQTPPAADIPIIWLLTFIIHSILKSLQHLQVCFFFFHWKPVIPSVKYSSSWAVVAPASVAPLAVQHETRQLFSSSSESSERGQRLPKINRPSVQPQGWVRVSLHGAHSLGSQCSYPNTAAHLSAGWEHLELN